MTDRRTEELRQHIYMLYLLSLCIFRPNVEIILHVFVDNGVVMRQIPCVLKAPCTCGSFYHCRESGISPRLEQLVSLQV